MCTTEDVRSRPCLDQEATEELHGKKGNGNVDVQELYD